MIRLCRRLLQPGSVASAMWQLTYQFSRERDDRSQRCTCRDCGTRTGPNCPGCLIRPAGAGEGLLYSSPLPKHYIGATYEFQRLLTHPSQVETQTHSAFVFYTLYLPPSLTVSRLRGTGTLGYSWWNRSSLRKWSPAAGASVSWHGQRTSFGSQLCARGISDGGGLSGAVRSTRADVSGTLAAGQDTGRTGVGGELLSQ